MWGGPGPEVLPRHAARRTLSSGPRAHLPARSLCGICEGSTATCNTFPFVEAAVFRERGSLGLPDGDSASCLSGPRAHDGPARAGCGGRPRPVGEVVPGFCSRCVLHEGAGVGRRGCEAGDLGHGRPGEVPQRLSLVLQGRQWRHLGVRHHQEGEAPPGGVPTRLRDAPSSLCSRARGRQLLRAFCDRPALVLYGKTTTAGRKHLMKVCHFLQEALTDNPCSSCMVEFVPLCGPLRTPHGAPSSTAHSSLGARRIGEGCCCGNSTRPLAVHPPQCHLGSY